MKLIDNIRKLIPSSQKQTKLVQICRHLKPSQISESEVSRAIDAWKAGNFENLHDIFNTMHRDPHLQSVLNSRTLAVSSLPFDFTVPDEDDRKTDFLTIYVKPLIRDLVKKLSAGFPNGAVMLRLTWDTTTEFWYIPKIDIIPMRNYKWKDGAFRRVMREGITETFKDLNPLEEIWFTPQELDNLPYGTLTSCIDFFRFKWFAAHNWAAFTEIYGMPMRIGKYNQGASDTDIDRLYNMLAGLGTDAAAVIPESTMVEFIEAKVRQGNDIYDGLISRANSEISKAVLGQTLTTETADRGNYAAAKAHQTTKSEYQFSDAWTIAEWINEKIISPLIQANFPIANVADLPRLIFNFNRITDPLNFVRTLEIAQRMGHTIHKEDLIRAGITVGDEDVDLKPKNASLTNLL